MNPNMNSIKELCKGRMYCIVRTINLFMYFCYPVHAVQALLVWIEWLSVECSGNYFGFGLGFTMV